jgi:polyisoprenoid-binding protein YceI
MRLLVLALFLCGSVALPKGLALEGTKTHVQFLAVGNPSALKIKGETPSEAGAVKGQLTVTSAGQMTGTASCNLKTLDTGIETRNKHMKEKYLEVGKYPEAKLEITKLPANLNADDAKIEGAPFEGILDLHGMKRPVTGTANFKKSGSTVRADFEFKLKVSDYKIDLPSFMGITMADEVTVKVATEGDLS